ncbi:MAG: ATP-binding protein [Byssovorax sp.]
MDASTAAIDSQRLLRFARDLQRVTDFDALVAVIQREIGEVVGYAHTWLCVLEPDLSHARVLSYAGDREPIVWERAQRIPVAGDPMMEEILRGDAPVVVTDARSDPRTNKDIVAALGNRTIVNVPLAVIDGPLGCLGTGTFGDEGVRPPTQGELAYLTGMATQVSVAIARIRWLDERAALERERAAVQRRMLVAQKMESIGMLAGGLAHDLNNLLMIVLLGADRLGKSPLAEPQRADLDAIASSARRGAALTRQLLDISRPRPDKIEVVDLRHRLADLVALLRRAQPETQSVELVEGGGPALVAGDAAQLDQVFMNLCVNARDAMPDGGRLRIEIAEAELREAYLEAYPWARAGRYVVVTVSDTGRGIAPAIMERIFEPFFTTKEPGKGTGLGLSVAYGVVRQHGGVIHAYSEPGLGTTIKVHLPAHEAGEAPRIEQLAEPPPLGSERILVAEDDPGVRSAIVRILRDAGYSVTTAVDGADAIAAVLRERFDLVILDLVMPKLGGAKTYEQVQELRPGLPCLFSTGFSAEALPSSLEASAAIELLHKPYDPDRLLRAVRRALDLRKG